MEIDTTSPLTTPMDLVPVDNHELMTSEEHIASGELIVSEEPVVTEEQPNKRRRKKSIVWEHFTIETVGAGCMRAVCKQCKKSFAYITGSKLAGTSHLKRHIALGICPVSRQRNEAFQSTPGMKSAPPKKRHRASPGFTPIPFDQERYNNEIAKMIIEHEYPVHIVEHPAFIDFIRTLQPQYSMASYNTIEGECVDIYLREKLSLSNLISSIPGRVSITLDLGTSNQYIGYAFLTGHFIDSDWNLQRRILNVVMLPFPDSDYAFNQAVASCLSDWHLESKLFTITLDQSFSNETMTENLRGLLSSKNQHLFNGQLLKGNCYARVLSRLAQDILGAMGETVQRIRESVKYVKTSEAHDEKFAELRQQLQVPSTKELIVDDQYKWNTTYQMLVAACELKEVFACLDTSDPVYRINPSLDDWRQVEIFCTYLKLFYDAANFIAGPTDPPANAFFHEVSKIQLELTHATMSPDPFVSNLTRPLKQRFDQYWNECFLALAIAVVMDPRFKMRLLEFSFPKIFGDEAGMWVKIVDDGIHELFLEYLAPNRAPPPPTGSEAPQEVVLIPPQEGPSDEVPAQEVPSQEVHPQELAPQEVETKQVILQEVHPQDAPAEEMQQKEASPQGFDPQEVPLQEVPAPEMQHAEEVQQQEMPHQEVSSQEMHSEEVSTREMPALEAYAQEMTSHEVPPQEIANEEMHDQELPPQELQSQEVQPQELQNQEIQPQEMQTPEVKLEEIQTSEVQPQEMQSQKVPHEEKQAQEVQAREMQTQEVLPQEVDAQAVQAPQEMDTQEVQAPPEMDSQEVQAPPEMDSQEVQATQEMDSQEVQAPQEMDTQEVQTRQEMDNQEVEAPQEMDNQEVEAPQEMDSQEVQTTQEMDSQEVQAPQEMDTQEVYLPQEMGTQEVQPQEMQTGEVPAQETGTQELPPQQMPSQQLPSQEMHAQLLSQGIQHHEADTGDVPLLSLRDGLSAFDMYVSEIASSQNMKSELDQYLEESLMPRVQDFDVLGWWKLNKLKYPTLSKMVADILSIPLSTVGPDSVFDTQNKRIYDYRSSLRPVTLEALVCAKDWLQYGSSSSSSSMETAGALTKMEF